MASKHPILTDSPAPQDALDFQPYIDSLADLMADPATSTPITIGVFGQWGSGKTTLMKLIQKQVDARQYKTVWFNAWKYEREALALWRVLILRTLDALRPRDGHGNLYAPEQLGEKDQKLVKELDRLEQSVYRTVEWTELGRWTVDWAKALESTGEFAADVALSLVPGGAPLVSALRNLRSAIKGKEDVAPVVEAFQREAQTFRREQLRSVEQFIQSFEELIADHVKSKQQRLVVFVDDLDRCLPERTVEVLEAIKLFLDVEGCIFVLGVDPSKVQEGIRMRYQGKLSEEEGANYLEKIIQLPFILPAIDSGYMRRFVEQLQVDFPKFGCVDVFAQGMAPNPRQIKRAINIFLLLWKLAQKRALELTPIRLAKLVVIQHSHPDLYELLKLVPRYLADLEIYYLRRQKVEEARRHAPPTERDDEAIRQIPLPAPLEPFRERAGLRQLFILLTDDLNAQFGSLTPTQLRSYLTLAGRAGAERRTGPTSAQRVIEPEMVSVPAGPFLMGSSQEEVQQGVAEESETPQHSVELPAYEIGRYPVTNLEYKAFVEAVGHPLPSHWEKGEMPDDLADHPVTFVSWEDAVAYCQWLSEVTGKSYRLPTEAEWEKAASWVEGQKSGKTEGQKRHYPWGDQFDKEKCNTAEAEILATTPVGQFSPAGDSPYGCVDMAGNVWEWCSTSYGDYPFQVQDEWSEDYLKVESRRVVRGGAFNDDRLWARTTYRYRNGSGFTSMYYGFRVARPVEGTGR